MTKLLLFILRQRNLVLPKFNLNIKLNKVVNIVMVRQTMVISTAFYVFRLLTIVISFIQRVIAGVGFVINCLHLKGDTHGVYWSASSVDAGYTGSFCLSEFVVLRFVRDGE